MSCITWISIGTSRRSLLRLPRRGGCLGAGHFNPAWYVYLPLRNDLRVERGAVLSEPVFLRRKFQAHGFRDVRITGMGILPRTLLSRSVGACRWQDRLGDGAPLRWFAYRYVIEGTR